MKINQRKPTAYAAGKLFGGILFNDDGVSRILLKRQCSRPAELEAVALAAHAAKKAHIASKVASAKKKAAAANSVPALREAVANLIAAFEELQK